MLANGSNMAIAEAATRRVQHLLIERSFLPARRVDGR